MTAAATIRAVAAGLTEVTSAASATHNLGQAAAAVQVVEVLRKPNSRRFWIVARAATSSRLPLRPIADLEQKSVARQICRPTRLLVRDSPMSSRPWLEPWWACA
jgi:hypothetical protein